MPAMRSGGGGGLRGLPAGPCPRLSWRCDRSGGRNRCGWDRWSLSLVQVLFVDIASLAQQSGGCVSVCNLHGLRIGGMTIPGARLIRVLRELDAEAGGEVGSGAGGEINSPPVAPVAGWGGGDRGRERETLKVGFTTDGKT